MVKLNHQKLGKEVEVEVEAVEVEEVEEKGQKPDLKADCWLDQRVESVAKRIRTAHIMNQ